MKRFVLAILPMCLLNSAHAQMWHESYENQVTNLRYQSVNPTRLSYNTLRDYGVAVADYNLVGGRFHAVDQSGDVNNLGVYIGGLRKVGKVDLAGHIRYDNIKEHDRRWNSTLWLDQSNPFVLGDSVTSNVTTEAFDLNATASYEISPKWKGGLEINLRLGTLSDQDDPRPKTHTSAIPITAGAEYQLSPRWTIGLVGGVTLFHSTVSYSIINPLVNHRFFIMNGMGDYHKMSAESGYDRTYKGTTYRGGVQAVWQGENISNITELTIASGDQITKDGENSYTFRAGDYSFMSFALNDRMMLKRGRMLHNIILDADYKFGKGDWYDQKRVVDTEHGNRVYYQILTKYKIHDINSLSSSVGYRMDVLKSDGIRNFFVEGKAAFAYLMQKHHLSETTPKQDISYIDISAKAGKEFRIKDITLLAQLGGKLRMPLTTTFESGSSYSGADDISYVYAAHQFEYMASSRAGVNFAVDANMPVGKNLTAGAYVKGDLDFYTGNNDNWQGYSSSSYTMVNFGLYLKF